MEKRSVILKQISDVGMKLIDEVIINRDEMKESDDYFFKPDIMLSIRYAIITIDVLKGVKLKYEK